MLFQEYLRFYEINLLFFEIKTLTNNNKLINVLIYNNYRQNSPPLVHLVRSDWPTYGARDKDWFRL